MSVKLMSRVWGLKLDHSEQSVLLVLADHADDDGERAFPSVGKIAWKTGYTERQVQRILRKLEKSGVLALVKRGGRGRGSEYRIDLSRAEEKPPFVPLKGDNMSPFIKEETPKKGDICDQAASLKGDISSIKGDISSQKGDIAMSHEPSVEPSVEPPILKVLTPQQQMVHDLALVMGVDDKLNGRRLARFASELLKQGYSPEQIVSVYGRGGRYWSEDWRGQKGQLPGEPAIRETIAKLNGETHAAYFPAVNGRAAAIIQPEHERFERVLI